MRARAFLLLLCLLFSCAGKEPAPPQGVIPQDRFADLYADLLRLDRARPPSASDSLLAAKGVDSLLGHYAITREEVRASVAWYNQDVTRWRPIMDSTIARLERTQPAP